MMPTSSRRNLRLLSVLAALLAGAWPASAQTVGRVTTREALTVTDTAGGLSAGTLTGITSCTFTVNAESVYFRLDGTAAAAGDHLATTGTSITVNGPQNVQRLSLVRAGGTNADVTVTCWNGAASPAVFEVSGGGGAAATIEGGITVGAQPADDPHHVLCSDGSQAAPCEVADDTVRTNTAGTNTRIGEVQDTPSQYTVLARLKAIEDSIAALAGALDETAGGVKSLLVDAMGDPITPVNDRCRDDAKVTPFEVSETAATGNVRVVAPDGSEVIYLCSLEIIVGGASSVTLETGTGGTCGTGNAVHRTYGLTEDTPGIVLGVGLKLKSGAGGELCIGRGSSVTLTGGGTYVQE